MLSQQPVPAEKPAMPRPTTVTDNNQAPAGDPPVDGGDTNTLSDRPNPELRRLAADVLNRVRRRRNQRRCARMREKLRRLHAAKRELTQQISYATECLRVARVTLEIYRRLHGAGPKFAPAAK